MVTKESTKSLNKVKIELIEINMLLNIIVETYKIEELSHLIERKFLLNCQEYEVDVTGEQMFKKCKNKKYIISIGYGKWYPFIISAENKESNLLIKQIFDWLKIINIPV